MTYDIERVTALTSAHRYGNSKSVVSFLLTDSRSLSFPEATLFFAIKSNRNDGHRYIADLYRRGVRNFVVEVLPNEYSSTFADANFLKVENTLASLQRLAERHRDEFNIPVIGITGSNGKTIVKEWLNQILCSQMRVTRSPRSYNSQIGVPLSVWLIDKQTHVAIIEAGISRPGEMQTLRNIIQPTISVLTNIGAAHQENFSSLEEKCEEKLKLISGTSTAVYCIDDKVIAQSMAKSNFKGERLFWSTSNPDAPMFITSIEKNADTATISYIYKGEAGQYSIPFIDEASVQNSINCAIIALLLGVDKSLLSERMSLLEPVAMRLEVKKGRHGCTLINDSYNSDIASLDIALDFMSRRPDNKHRRHTLILSDILQSGASPDILYKEVSALSTKRGVDKIIGIGDDISSQADVIDVPEKMFFNDVASFIDSDAFHSLRDEVVLIKGARDFDFDKLTELLVEKVHETTLEVNLNALINNLNYYRSFMNAGTKIVCMIKAEAYGAGAVEIAKTLQDHCVDYLAVAVADEGATLRRNGITASIIVMNPEMSSFKTLFDYNLEPEIYSFHLLDALMDAARKEGISNLPVHIKLDTGMHRLGFDPDKDIEELIKRLKQDDTLMPRSVFTHFVGSDSDAFNDFSEKQFSVFLEAATRLQASFDHKIIRHISNSAAIEHFPERQLDMCRLGIGLYGVNPLTNSILSNVCSLRTTILQKRAVPAGDTVGYSRRGVLTRKSIIATIPIGYADGLNRHLGNRCCYCLVNGQKAEYVGNICMDVAMIDVTDIDCKEGDSVEIFGDNLPVTVLSDALATIPYEVLTGISNRVKRVYFQD